MAGPLRAGSRRSPSLRVRSQFAEVLFAGAQPVAQPADALPAAHVARAAAGAADVRAADPRAQPQGRVARREAARLHLDHAARPGRARSPSVGATSPPPLRRRAGPDVGEPADVRQRGRAPRTRGSQRDARGLLAAPPALALTQGTPAPR